MPHSSDSLGFFKTVASLCSYEDVQETGGGGVELGKGLSDKRGRETERGNTKHGME